MGFNSFSANAFANNFMTGFNFVDQIKARKKAEGRLEDRLAQDREERSFQRKRTVELDQQVRSDRAFTQTERDRIADERNQRASGEKAALNPDSTDEELLQFAPFSPGAASALKQRIGEDRFKEAMAQVQTIPQAGLVNAVTQSQGAQQSVAESPSNQTQAITGEQAPQTQGGTSQFEASRGTDALKTASEEDIEAFNPAFQEAGFAGQIAQRVGGSFQQVSRGIGNIFEAGARLRGGDAVVPGTRATGAAFSGESFVANDFVSKADFDLIADPQERESVRARNEEIITGNAERALDPSRNRLSIPITEQGAVQEGGELARDEAQRIENRIVGRYQDFLDGNGDSALEEMALNDPSAAAVDYFESRATLINANADMAEAADRRMVPVLDAYAQEVQLNIANEQPGTAEYRRLTAQSKNIQASRDVIAKQQPKTAKRSNISSAGLKVGDTQRVNSVVEAMYDPNTPTQNTVQPGQLNAALAVAGRISPNRRLNEAQIEGLAIMAQGGYLPKPAALNVMMTGAWPPGQNPNEIKKTVKSGETTYAVTEGGQYFVLPDVVGARKSGEGELPSREIGSDQIGWALEGAKTWGMDDSRNGQVVGLMSDHAGWIRQHYNTQSQEQMRAMGRALGQSVFLSASEHKRLSEEWFGNPKDTPSAEDILLNPSMRRKLAEEYNVRPVPMPPVTRTTDLDLEPVRSDIREGIFGPVLAEQAQSLTDEQVMYIYWTTNATSEDIAAANAGQ